MSEKNSPLEEIGNQMAGGLIFSAVQLLRQGGLDTSAALRLSAFTVLLEVYGEGVIETLEIPRSTYMRYRREIREAAKTLPDDSADFTNKAMHQVVDLLTNKKAVTEEEEKDS